MHRKTYIVAFNMKKYLLTVVGVLLGTIILLGCKGKTNKESSTYSLKIGAMASMDYLPYLVAQEVGIYDSLGLNIDFIKFFSPNERDAAFRSGQIDGTIIDYSGAAMQHAAGIGLSLIAKHDGFFELLSTPTITSPENILGKSIGISRNTVIEYSCDRMLESAHIQETAIKKTEVNKIPVRLEMILAGELDAGIFPDPFITIGKSKGCHSLFSTKELGISVTGMIMSTDAMTHKAEAIKLLLEGYNEGVKYIQTHPREEWAKVLVEKLMLPEELINAIQLPQYTYAEMPAKEEIEKTLAWLHSKQLIPEQYNGEGLLNKDFIPLHQ